MRTKQFFMIMLLILSSTLVFYGCDTGGSSSGGGKKTGTHTIILKGGSGSGGQGGNGGTMTIDSLRSVNIKNSDSADTSFSLPSERPAFIAVGNTLKVSSGASVFVNAVALTDPVPLGSYFMLYNVPFIQKDDGDGVAEDIGQDVIIDSIDIAKDATVTLDMNFDTNNLDADAAPSTGGDTAQFEITGDLRVSGTLTVGLLNSADGATDDETTVPSSGSIVIDARNIFVTGSGKVLAMGGDMTTDHGGDGGYIWLGADNGADAYLGEVGGYLRFDGTCNASGGNATGAGNDGGSSGNCDLFAEGLAINTGSVYTDGGDGENGGDANWSDVYAYGPVYNTGNFYQRGGTGTNGDGGDADSVEVFSYDASVYAKGTIEVTGGDGTADGGSVKQGVHFYSDDSVGYTGIIKINMNITAAGGDSTVDGNGGQGGYFIVQTFSGPVDIAGSFDGRGGDASGVGNTGGTGGGGTQSNADSEITVLNSGELYLGGSPGYIDGPLYIDRPDGDVTISMDFDFSGGDGYFGGSSTNFIIDTGTGFYTQYASPAAGETNLAGFKSINLSGGDCTADCDGGEGGSVGINTYSEFLVDDAAPYPTGAIINQVPITANGGNGNGTGLGGNAQYVYFSGDGQQNDSTSIIKNSAQISLMGGSGGDGGHGGSVYMFGYGQVTNSGKLNLSGGNGTFTGGNGNDYDLTEIVSVTDVANNGKIVASGGDSSSGDGGYADGYALIMYAGHRVKNSAQIVFTGGDGATSGGNGGEIDIFSHGQASSNTAPINVSGGADTTDGSEDGSNGHIFIDWVDITPADGSI